MDNVKLKASEKNIQIKTEVIASTNTAGGIVDYAEDKDVDLIVIGTRENYLLLLHLPKAAFQTI